MKSITSRAALFGASAVAALSLGVPSANAQTATESGAMDEILVTARKTSEDIQTTPVAVTAATAADLEENQIAVLSDLQRIAPSLATSTGGPGGPGVIYLAIRGQVNNAAGSATDSAVGTYVDGVYFARPTSGNFGVLDAAQVEILRGPQGTLFGRNTTGGALNITTSSRTANSAAI